MTETTPEVATDLATEPLPLVELGWVQVGSFLDEDRQALRRARQAIRERLRALFPQFRWRLHRIDRRVASAERRRRPAELLAIGSDERDLNRWDLTFVVTDSDLVTYRKPFALGAPSRALGTAVLSTARLLGDVEDDPSVDEIDIQVRRLTALTLHLFGHLAFLDNRDEPTDYLYEFEHPRDLDHMERFARDELPELREQLADFADERLEETGRFEGRIVGFYLRAAWLQRREIWSSMLRVEPWMFPFRLGRLTTAAGSALVLLLVTAETWELGMSQPVPRVAVLSLVTIGGLAAMLLRRQGLLFVQRSRQPSEQQVASNLAITLAMLVGLTLIYSLLFLATYGMAEVLFSQELLAQWTPSLDGEIGARQHVAHAGFIAFLGLIVGALGASFEEQDYFRHITLVDEET
ncbi:MAG: DUF2391 domain-containing protein [Acidobacteriota bacterium]